MDASEQVKPADEGRLERGVRALDPERSAFEAWCCKRWAGDRNALTIRDDGEYLNGHVQFAWCAWQAARPKRAAVGRLINLAADCAQRKPLRGLEPLTEVTHIGHRQLCSAPSGQRGNDMSTFSGNIGPEEEDGAGWGGLVPTKDERAQEALEFEARRGRALVAAVNKALAEALAGAEECRGKPSFAGERPQWDDGYVAGIKCAATIVQAAMAHAR